MPKQKKESLSLNGWREIENIDSLLVSDQVLCQIQTYCSGVSVPAQVETAAVPATRTTAS